MKETDVPYILNQLYNAHAALIGVQDCLNQEGHTCPRCHTYRYDIWADRVNARSLSAAITKIDTVIGSINGDDNDNQT